MMEQTCTEGCHSDGREKHNRHWIKCISINMRDTYEGSKKKGETYNAKMLKMNLIYIQIIAMTSLWTLHDDRPQILQ